MDKCQLDAAAGADPAEEAAAEEPDEDESPDLEEADEDESDLDSELVVAELVELLEESRLSVR